MTREVRLLPVVPFPLVQPGDDIAALVSAALEEGGLQLQDGDILVLAQKIVSKAEGRYVKLAEVTVGPEAQALAARANKEPALVQLILNESREVLRVRPGVIIVEHRNGYVHANAGIDRSNIPSDAAAPAVLLLPENPDASAASLRRTLSERYGVEVAVIINDSAGRAWRNGTQGFALGCSGIEPVEDLVGTRDLFGRPMEVTEVAVADELAAAASLVMGQADEACPVVLVRGARFLPSEQGSSRLLRDRALDMFR
ncbi:MAG: coenzyme F420-0:L-glutamate ligase [Halieaceae bacterium]|jgi:coenzyme F420-0:L-glutamate ligase/coenzyme F420-1:gamma-L-glutamate ligase|nr:coenzyme F420-0:L-glutamate ligase [Halieaceae bacterium]